MSFPTPLTDKRFFIDPVRCIGCKACVQACSECGTHRGRSMISLEFMERGSSTQTVPMVCMHCDDPTCAAVCPADAIKRTEDGVVQSSLKERCIGCSNCVNACPFGVPQYHADIDQMLKCDMCYDRTAYGLRPMCATVCPSEALFFGTLEEFQSRRRGTPVNEFQFGSQTIRTKVFMVLPDNEVRLDVDADDHASDRDGRFDRDVFDHVDPFADLEGLPMEVLA
ncbi:MAG TPA: 4Fe-4S dicluster domain-containing protein [Deinococcales bacterium]|nr:4Fe-4S dicluster domain-containing protein [Deinococcales bacterium]